MLASPAPGLAGVGRTRSSRADALSLGLCAVTRKRVCSVPRTQIQVPGRSCVLRVPLRVEGEVKSVEAYLSKTSKVYSEVGRFANETLLDSTWGVVENR